MARDQLFPIVYDELRRRAASYMRREDRGHTLQPTALVNEAYLRLTDQNAGWKNRSQFFAVASQIMRRILVDHARRQLAVKRGSGDHPVELDEAHVATDRPPALVALGNALKDLVKFDERKARVTVLHYFGGLSHEEIATVCGIHANTVSRDLRCSEAWLRGHSEA